MRWVLCCCFSLGVASLSNADAIQGPVGKGADARIFAQPTLFSFKIDLSPEDAASLKREPRKSVPAKVEVDGREFARLGVHLKGAQGSFRPLDEKPALTLAFGKFTPGQNFFGLRKIHLNNSVQDSTYLCEDLAGELFRRAGVPAPRTAWATVELNGRKLGLYVLKEGFSKDFLAVHFKNATGNLYDGGLHHEITEPLELDSGDGSPDRSDLVSLAAAAQEADLKVRWERLQRVLDLDRFISFMATEILAGHIDGYSLMQNNYRLYFDPTSGRAVFLPHGMDRMFYEPQAALEPTMKGLVATAVLTTPQGLAGYRQRLAELSEKVFNPEWLTNRIDSAVRLLAQVEPLVARESQPLRQRIVARAACAKAAAAKWR